MWPRCVCGSGNTTADDMFFISQPNMLVRLDLDLRHTITHFFVYICVRAHTSVVLVLEALIQIELVYSDSRLEHWCVLLVLR